VTITELETIPPAMLSSWKEKNVVEGSVRCMCSRNVMKRPSVARLTDRKNQITAACIFKLIRDDTCKFRSS